MGPCAHTEFVGKRRSKVGAVMIDERAESPEMEVVALSKAE